MKNINVLITGHTGFKGSWLTALLHSLGANVYGYSLEKNATPIYEKIRELDLLAGECIGDINDETKFREFAESANPEIVFHMAAQPLVIESYEDPISTFDTNVVGTAKVLNGLRCIANLKSIVVITTDKCYRNNEWCWPYRETDALGGHDPYSASKACTELVVDSFRNSFFNTESSPLIATVRAGNVIGGGDPTQGRLLPDIATALVTESTLETRNPYATRPWQHVLEPITGYLSLAMRMRSGEDSLATAWNFGPAADANKSVGEILNVVESIYSGFKWKALGEPKYHEAKLLSLDSSKANFELSWSPNWDFDTSIEKTLQWYVDVHAGNDPFEVTLAQLKEFMEGVNYDFS
ncbi:CDP-glucose 4,6-dehydratase [Pseudoalteromonas umbrosa]|uniref:CDP-glucose 4,6-dehydratase n=1 Tax=Pseudoalteromonas umbrosa TaxID=3048489 RepID=UPI0024C32E33|nr:CDP-glucose 4,6-dehydratase [Pseudoalteromonas sp. B95]MDK1289568.1 CDP-glucose 4,6-dehydratase [Pseudoalteromonas sp. B95]